MPVQKRVNHKFFREWSEEMAYVLGFFLADGTITLNNLGGAYIAFQIKEQCLLELIRATFQSEHKIAKRIDSRTDGVMYRLQIGSKQMVADLAALGIKPGKTTRLDLPKMNDCYFPHFLRGYFDGDGNVWVGATHTSRTNSNVGILVSFTSGSRKFLESLQERLSVYQISGSMFAVKNRAAWRLQFSTNSSILLHRLMYDTLSGRLYLPEKRNRFAEYLRQKKKNLTAVVAQLVSSTRLSRGRLRVRVPSTAQLDKTQNTSDQAGVLCFRKQTAFAFVSNCEPERCRTSHQSE